MVLALLPLPGLADTLNGRVVGVHDGDTITVLDANKTQYKIRLAGIDAPELKQAFGSRSRQNLSGLIFDTDVTHHVTVLAGGYEYKGKAYRSLTAIARQITGTAWSGPVFFGLRS